MIWFEVWVNDRNSCASWRIRTPSLLEAEKWQRDLSVDYGPAKILPVVEQS